ncbi:MAG: exosome complex RNA-binding protein Rrp4 [Candidatus Hydrothermarchaeales archaeon]
MRKMVLPGELILEGNLKIGTGVYREGDRIYASVLGLVDQRKDMVRVIPMTGKYIPHVRDFVIATVKDIQFSSWILDINAPYSGVLTPRDYIRDFDTFQTDLSEIMTNGEMFYAMIREVSPRKRVFLTMKERGSRKLKGGRILEITPAKVPRVIGKKSSMLSMIKKETGCQVVVGQNGWIWVNGKEELVNIVVEIIKKIEKEAHIPGLTNNIKDMIIKAREKL